MKIQKKILIVDEEKIIRKNLKYVLTENEYQVFLASNGREALNKSNSTFPAKTGKTLESFL